MRVNFFHIFFFLYYINIKALTHGDSVEYNNKNNNEDGDDIDVDDNVKDDDDIVDKLKPMYDFFFL